MNIKALFHWLYGYIINYNLFVSETVVNDNDTDQLQESLVVLKRQRYATWLYIFLLIGKYHTSFSSLVKYI